MDISQLPLLRDDPLLWQDTASRPVPGTVVPCLMCTDPFIMPKFLGEPDQVCPRCRKDYDELARLVCQHCRATIGRIHPGTIDSGYFVRPRSVLHTNYCNVCRPGLKTSTVIEIAQWEKMFRPKKIIVPTRIR